MRLPGAWTLLAGHASVRHPEYRIPRHQPELMTRREEILGAGLFEVFPDDPRSLRRYRAALDGGADPLVVGQWINKATAARLAELRRQAGQALNSAQVRRLLAQAGVDTVAGRLATADHDDRARLYQALGIELVYQPAQRLVAASAEPGRCTEGVGGGT